jgi:hypothetical protein
VDLSWAAGEGDAEAKGTLKLVDAGPEDLDDLEPSEVKAPAGGAGAAAAAAKALAAPLRAALRGFYEELRQR